MSCRLGSTISNRRRCDPGNAMVWYHLGLADRNLGAWDDAARAFARAIESNPGLAEARKALAELERRGPAVRLLHGLKGLFRGR